MKPHLLILLLLACAARAQTPEELYEAYSTPETRAVLERFEEAERRSQEAEAAAKARRTLALGGAILIGLIPLGYGRWLWAERFSSVLFRWAISAGRLSARRAGGTIPAAPSVHLGSAWPGAWSCSDSTTASSCSK